MSYTSTHLEDYVAKALLRFEIHSPDQLTIPTIASKVGVGYALEEGTSRTIRAGKKQLIVLNSALSPQEQWIDFAHEIGHVLCHTGNQHGLPFPFIELQEWQADNFALHFCVPSFMLRNIHLPFYKQRAIGIIAETFNVTYAFAAKRIEMWINSNIHFSAPQYASL